VRIDAPVKAGGKGGTTKPIEGDSAVSCSPNGTTDVRRGVGETTEGSERVDDGRGELLGARQRSDEGGQKPRAR
jgi:hypothetical protein